jgi:hypothetical protein
MELGSNGIQNKGSGGAPTPPPAPSGVLFKTIEPSQYTSYLTGDEGWRAQNGFFDYTPPTNPAAVAELDYTSANFFWVLKNPLVVNGVSSTTRFVDVNGIQAFSATGNANLVVIDKLTGLMFTKTLLTAAVWGTAISNALAYSIIVNSITYDDWYVTSLNECLNIYNLDQTVSINVDSATGVTIFPVPTSIWVSTSQTGLSKYNFQNLFRTITSQNAPAPLSTIAVTNARNLITAP